MAPGELMTAEDITQAAGRVLCSGSMARPRVVFLGTGGALNPERYQATILIECGITRVLLDTGGGLGVVRRLLAAEVDPGSVGHVFLSHRHLDHVGGLEPLLMSVFYRSSRDGQPPPPVRLYALPGSAHAIRASLAAADASGARVFGERLTWITPARGAAVALDAGARLTLVAVDHLPPGGEAGGCVVAANGARVVYSGDTRPSEALVDAARRADLLIHEVGGSRPAPICCTGWGTRPRPTPGARPRGPAPARSRSSTSLPPSGSRPPICSPRRAVTRRGWRCFYRRMG
jgi:glyoxylase-like metal-dependent hydrolase (beta-lactamase superfamily II)